MSDQNDNEPIILDHNYDGIQEYDNPLPTWWLTTFFITIIFGFLYWIDAETAGRMTQVEEANAELAVLRALGPKIVSGATSEEEFKLLAAVATNGAKGKEVFTAKCAVCHGSEGQGSIGPNLTDEFWLHGKGGFSDVAKVISEGVLDKGMPPWVEQLSPDELKTVTVFVVSMRGTNLANAKPPQGEKVSP